MDTGRGDGNGQDVEPLSTCTENVLAVSITKVITAFDEEEERPSQMIKM
jgi:hypothetical protein